MTQPDALSEWLEALRHALQAGSFVKLKLSKPTAQAGDVKSVDGRLIRVKQEVKLSLTYHHHTKDIVKNYALDELTALLTQLLKDQYEAASLCTTEADWALRRQGASHQLQRHKPSHHHAPDLSHDRSKQRLIGAEGKPYLQALGITDANGKVRPTMQDKFRQINKYTEILDGLIGRMPATKQPLRIVDMGAGKGYLTFTLYDHVAHTLKQPVEMTGVEFRPELVAQCNVIAKASGFDGLHFVQGAIADYDCSGTDVVIALHACDTATDDAIAKAVHAGASLIVVAPCCHKQIRRAMGACKTEHSLHFMLQHGTYAERMAEMITDGMRAQLMALQGYQTQLFEFISDSHTPKNVMIVASKSPSPLHDAERATLQQAIAAAKSQFGIGYHQLERLLS